MMAAYTNNLQVPVIISDLLCENCEDAQADDLYALSCLMSDMGPAPAMASIAAGLRVLVQPFLHASPSLQIAELSCMRILEDIHLQGEGSVSCEDLSEGQLSDLLEYAEDMSELLELVSGYLRAKDPLALKLCSLLNAQLDAQVMILEQVQSALACQADAFVANNVVYL